jgi:hypothetical protein
VAVASSIAASRFHTLVHHGYTTGAALTGGFTSALWVCGLTALVAVPVAFLLLRRGQAVEAVGGTQPGEVAVIAAPDLADTVAE